MTINATDVRGELRREICQEEDGGSQRLSCQQSVKETYVTKCE